MKQEKKCKVEDCNNKHYSLGYCKKHYMQFKRRGYILEGKDKRCKVEGCNNKHYGHGYCEKHLKQLKRTGKILDRTMQTPNEIIEYENYAEIILYDNNNKEKARTKIDLEDVDLVKNYKWCLQGKEFNYVMNYKLGLLHRYIMNPSDDMVVDHINHDTLDNRKNNLRVCTKKENSWNSTIQINSPSKYLGVKERNNMWEAQIIVNGKTIILGRFNTEEEAIRARLNAESEYYGEYAPNHNKKK